MAYIDDPQTQRANLKFIKASMQEPLLSRETEYDLAKRWREKQDEAALHRLVRAYTRLVISIASRFRNDGLPMGDLVQEGNVGLLQAAERFEPERGVRFSTYASWWIRSAMQDFILRNWSIVRTGTTAAQKSLFFNLRRLRAQIDDIGGEQLSEESRSFIANELKVNVHEVEAMEIRLNGGDQSLNAPVSDESEDSWQDFLADHRPNSEEVVIGVHDGRTRARWLVEALRELPPREQTIIRKRRLTENGFEATWKITSYGKNLPQFWLENTTAVDNATLLSKQFGVGLYQEVDFYTMVDRATKYSILFISLTFLTFFMYEVLVGLRIHPVQYLLVGLGIALFYLLLLSFAEITGFLPAYLISMIATIALVSGYCFSVLKARKRAAAIAALLLALYGYLYILLQLETFSLLFGSVLLFGVLATVMYLTRDLDWYTLNK